MNTWNHPGLCCVVLYSWFFEATHHLLIRILFLKQWNSLKQSAPTLPEINVPLQWEAASLWTAYRHTSPSLQTDCWANWGVNIFLGGDVMKDANREQDQSEKTFNWLLQGVCSFQVCVFSDLCWWMFIYCHKKPLWLGWKSISAIKGFYMFKAAPRCKNTGVLSNLEDSVLWVQFWVKYSGFNSYFSWLWVAHTNYKAFLKPYEFLLCSNNKTCPRLLVCWCGGERTRQPL